MSSESTSRGVGPELRAPARAARRARGSATTTSSGAARVGPASVGAHVGHGHVEHPPPAGTECLEAGPRRAQPAQRVGHGVGAEDRRTVAPHHESAGGGGVVAEGHPVHAGRSRPWPVMEIHTWGPSPGPTHPRSPSNAELFERPWAAGLNHDVGLPHEARQQLPALGAREVEDDRSFAPVHEIEERGRPAACPVGS